MVVGCYDGFWEFGLLEWDLVVGVLLIIEVGGLVGDFWGGLDYVKFGNIVCVLFKLFKFML